MHFWREKRQSITPESALPMTKFSTKRLCYSGEDFWAERCGNAGDHWCGNVFTVRHAEYDLLLREDIERLFAI